MPKRPPCFLHALEAKDPVEAALEPPAPCSFRVMRDPCFLARDCLPDPLRIRCPEMSHRTTHRQSSEWTPWGNTELVVEWSELDWLLRQHQSRRASWRRAPSHALNQHVLMSVLKGKVVFNSLWDECLEQCSLATHKGSGAMRLGDGEPWRFQAGAPFHMSDLASLVSVGTLTSAGAQAHEAWAAISALHVGEHGHTDAGERCVFLQFDTLANPE